MGNVLATVSDEKTGVDLNNDGTIDYYTANVVSANDYYPFGMMMPARTFRGGPGIYRYGFNGKENDKDITESTQDYGMRISDNRLGRFLSVDPLTKNYPELTPYQFASNSPIENSDLDGKESISETQHGLARQFEAQIQMKTALQTAHEQKIKYFTNPSNSTQAPSPPYLRTSSNLSPTEKTNAEVLFNINLQKEGYNYDLTKKPGTKLLDNKTFQNFSNNIALPVLEIASYTAGLGEAASLLKLSRALISTSKSEVSASALAKLWQGKGAYSGVDAWRDITLREGKYVVGGLPGQSEYYTTISGLNRSNLSKSNLWEGLQVQTHAVKGYRNEVGIYKIQTNTRAAFGTTYSNPQFGEGGLPQIFIPQYQDLKLIKTIPLK